MQPDEPAAPNPPDGAILDYWLPHNAQGPVTLQILDTQGHLLRSYSSATPLPKPNPMLSIPAYWLRPAQHLSAKAGLHRFLWDLHLQPVAGIPPHYPIAAVPHNTAPAPTSPFAMPGIYTVRLTVDGKSYTQPLLLREDPRVKTPMEGLQAQYNLSLIAYHDLQHVQSAIEQAQSTLHAHPNHALAELLGENPSFSEGPRAGRQTLISMRGTLWGMLRALQGADVAPTQPQYAAVNRLHELTDKLLAKAKSLGVE